MAIPIFDSDLAISEAVLRPQRQQNAQNTLLLSHEHTSSRLSPPRYHFSGSSTSLPPIYGRNASGIVSEPSSFWYVSSRATRVRPTANPDPLIVWQNTGLFCLPFASRSDGLWPRTRL